MSENVTLSRNQQRAIAALLSCTTTAEAAEKAGVSRQTLYRYLADKTFRAELARRQEAILLSVMAAIVGMAEEGINALRDVLRDPDTPAAVRVRAALGWLQHVLRAAEWLDARRAAGKDVPLTIRVVWDEEVANAFGLTGEAEEG